MSGKVFLFLLSFPCILSFKPYSPPLSLKLILSAYSKADRLFNSPNSNSRTDSICMGAFEKIIKDINGLPKSGSTDSLMFQLYFKLGILQEVYRDFPRATRSYLQAMYYPMDKEDKFKINVFAGTGFYNLNNFDSATYFLLKAEECPRDLGSSSDRVRLYNALGVLYYDNGNYLQSKNYFIQALGFIRERNPGDSLNAYSLQLNMATCFYKLGMYEQSLSICRKALNFHLFPDPLYMNMGKAYTGLHQYGPALASFKKVKTGAVPGVLNEMAITAMNAGYADSASTWLDQYRREKISLHTNALDDGVNELYSGELDIFCSRPESALRHLQEALIIFSRNFTEKDTRKNPQAFMGSFAYYRLFDVLVNKAAAWEMMYKKTSTPEDLRAAYSTYQSVISFLSYIERSYEMDDAKILLKQKSGALYSNALKVCLELNKLFPDSGFLNEAFLISEKNKASVMSAQIRERNFFRTGAEKDLAATERNIQFNIARLNSKADEQPDAASLQKINEEKSVYETRLVSLRRKMQENNRFFKLQYSDDFPSIEQLQNSMGSDQATISFYNEPEKIDVFVLTKSSFHFVQLDSGNATRHDIQSWIQTLQNMESGRHSSTKELNKKLYSELMKPVLNLAGDKSEWIVIPDGLFFLLPLESLFENSDGKLIIEDHAIGYEFSARFIMHDNPQFTYDGSNISVLSFAPFSQHSADLQTPVKIRLGKLPYSKDEIAGLKGSRFEDRQATKELFVRDLNSYPVIHLATHAFTDPDHPSGSYIAFYPSSGIEPDDFLFLDEIYSLRMDSCQMIVMSACETGRGELVSNEGVMSFARAFLYAGCPSTINTLWKADDRSTAEIFKSFYKYLGEGCTKPRALQKAKLDFIRNNPVSRDPAYWSHIILTGDPHALYKKKQPWFWAVFAIICATMLFFLLKKRKEKKVDAFHS